jgi:hypothetical protein
MEYRKKKKKEEAEKTGCILEIWLKIKPKGKTAYLLLLVKFL